MDINKVNCGKWRQQIWHRIDLVWLKRSIEPLLTRFVEDYSFVQKDKGLKMAKKDPLPVLPEP
ncbi:MAG: hypothetical protein L6427_06255, partial [Actinomycetia bacterium]|nr:hypothetical protein [Actinomycetes bacterium]